MSLPEVLAALLRRGRFLLVNSIIITALAVVVSFVLPHRYSATARVLPPPEDDPLGLTAQLGIGLTSQIGRLRTGMLGGGTPSDLMVGVLSSRTVLESVAVRCSVVARCRIGGGSLQEATRALAKMSHLTVGDEGIVSVTVEARRPDWAADMANCYVEQLDLFLRNSNMSRGKNMRVFLEGRLADVTREVDSASQALVDFQARHGLVAVNEQLEGIVASYAQLYATVLLKQTELRLLETRSSPGNPLVERLRRDVMIYRRQLGVLLGGHRGPDASTVPGLPLESLPSVTAEYLKLFGEVALLKEAHAMLYQQLEQARVMEARDTPTITVLDWATPPDRRSFPRRSLIVLAVFLFSSAVGILGVVVADYFRRAAAKYPDALEAWTELKQSHRALLRPLKKLFRTQKPRTR